MDKELELTQLYGLVFRDHLSISKAAEQVFGSRSSFYVIPEEDRQAIADTVKARVAAEIAEADAAFFQKREALRSQIMEEALAGVLSGVRELTAIIGSEETGAFNKVAAFKELNDVLRNGIMIPDRKFTPEQTASPEETQLNQPSLLPAAMFPLPMPGTLTQVKELRVTGQDGTVLTVVRPEVVEAD